MAYFENLFKSIQKTLRSSVEIFFVRNEHLCYTGIQVCSND